MLVCAPFKVHHCCPPVSVSALLCFPCPPPPGSQCVRAFSLSLRLRSVGRYFGPQVWHNASVLRSCRHHKEGMRGPPCHDYRARSHEKPPPPTPLLSGPRQVLSLSQRQVHTTIIPTSTPRGCPPPHRLYRRSGSSSSVTTPSSSTS